MAVPSHSVGRALVGSPLKRPLVGCLFLGAMLFLLGLAFLGHLTLWIIAPLPASSLFVGTALLATLASLPVLLFLWVLDRRERESVWLFGGAIAWGAVISTGLSALFNALGFGFIALGLELAGAMDDSMVIGELLAAALIAPPVEEAAKGLGVLLLFWFARAEFDNLRDGLIYGALVGLGFNIAEVALYVMNGYLETGTAPIGEQFATRFVFLGLNGHLLWSALVGAGLGLARQTSRRRLHYVAPIGGYLVALIGHALNNSVGIFVLVIFLAMMGYDLSVEASVSVPALWLAAALMHLLIQSGPYLLFGILLVQSSRWERKVLRDYLADEVDGVTVLPEEYTSIQGTIPLLGTHALARRGGRRTRRIANAQTELAFRKWHLARDNGDPAGDPLAIAWREDIARLRQNS